MNKVSSFVGEVARRTMGDESDSVPFMIFFLSFSRLG